MKKVLVLGGGKVGKSVGEMLLALGRGAFQVTLADRDAANLEAAEGNFRRLRTLVPHKVEYATRVVDATDAAAVRNVLQGHDYVICMLPFDLVAGVAEAANELGVHYFDVTEDVATTERVRAIADSGRAKVALVPQCGLAPGYIAIAAYALTNAFSRIDLLKLRVGALPQYPTNALRYNTSWSTTGVINEYCEPCKVMLDGKQVQVPALEGYETFSFEGAEYEAFYTSGGVGSLIDTLVSEGKTTDESKIAYKTIRYPGHRNLMRFMLEDLRLGVEHAKPGPGGISFDRRLAVNLIDHGISRTQQDVVVIFINCIGLKDGFRQQLNFKRAVRAVEMFGRVWPAIEYTTAAGVCAMVDLHRTGKLSQTGFVRQEECSLQAFNDTLFGLAYEAPDKMQAAVMGEKYD